ncbi:MAG TPA: hypothetical protein DF783_02265 [Acidimicrobiaceae bacterium]|nr:hypothetical protein [Acidimicrobiaceae bacterium]HCV35721.1 hypothetical protein [Acidimicrobiaceae bacterium]
MGLHCQPVFVDCACNSSLKTHLVEKSLKKALCDFSLSLQVHLFHFFLLLTVSTTISGLGLLCRRDLATLAPI